MHISVLLKELIDGLNLEEGSIVLDATINGGGHAKAVCERIGEKGMLIGLDQDEEALARAKEKLKSDPCAVRLVKENFRNLDRALESAGIAHIDRAYFDLGLSSDQLEASGRGFSFQKDEPLLMTFSRDPKTSETAAHLVASLSEERLADLIYQYGEERFARSIAREIRRRRERKPIRGTKDLVEAVLAGTPPWYHKRSIHPATKTFQALRIAVNDEMESLREGLEKGFRMLAPKGRMGVISFHSGEDRIAKAFFAEKNRLGEGALLTKKPISPTREEIRENPRARSATLRLFEKT